MNILVSGSLAYDYIMAFPDSFKNHILPDHIHMLNVCFVVDELRKNFGGTAGNIGYTMRLLGADPLLFASLGSDGGEYADYLKKHAISIDEIFEATDVLTASAHITTDKDDNQITAFHNGALKHAANQTLSTQKDAAFAIIAPNQKDAMVKHAKECHDHSIPFCFDPGQQLTALSSQELMGAIGQATFYIVNDYELTLTKDKTGWDTNELLNHIEVLIITLGEKGSVIKTKDQTFEVSPCKPFSVDDPTGAGDAYRAGFFSAYVRGHDYQTCGQVGSVSAAYAIEHYGTQNHTFTLEAFHERYKETYGETVELSM